MKHYLIHLGITIGITGLLIGGALIYKGVYTRSERIIDLINTNEVCKIELKTYENGENNSLYLENDVIDKFLNVVNYVTYNKQIKALNLASNRTFIVSYNDESKLTFNEYHIFNSDDSINYDIYIDKSNIDKLSEVFSIWIIE